MNLETERTRLGPWNVEDWRAFHLISTDPEVMRFITGGTPWSESQTQEFVSRQIRHFAERGYCLWKFSLKSGGEMAGFCGIQPLDATKEIEIGWWLARSHWRQGIATEAAREVLRDAFTRIGLERVVAITLEENTASVAVMKKLGMTYERDHLHRGIPVVLYSLSRIQWNRNEPGKNEI